MGNRPAAPPHLRGGARAPAGHDRREAARGARRRRRDRHRPVHVHGLPGTVRREAHPPPLLPRGRDGRRGAPRVPVPDRDRHGDGATARLRVRELGDGLRRLQDDPGHVHDAARPLAREDGDGDLRRRGRAHERAGRGRAPHDPPPPGRAGEGGRLHVQDRVGARVLSLQGVLRGGSREALPGHPAVVPVHHGLPHARDHQGRVADPPDPQRDAGRGDPDRVLEGRVRSWPTRDQHHVRGRPDDRRLPRACTSTARRRSPP